MQTTLCHVCMSMDDDLVLVFDLFVLFVLCDQLQFVSHDHERVWEIVTITLRISKLDYLFCGGF